MGREDDEGRDPGQGHRRGLRARTTIIHCRGGSTTRRREPVFNALAPLMGEPRAGNGSWPAHECIWTIKDDPRIAALTAALADACGAIVEEDADGWSAVEPFTPRWPVVPGAHWLWNARRAARGFVVRSVAACTHKTIDQATGRFGWDLLTPTNHDPDTIVATFLHPVLPAPGTHGNAGDARRIGAGKDDGRTP